MAKDPAFLFYPGDYIAGTMHLDFVCKGAYIDLLMLQFNRGHMTIDMIKHMLGDKFAQVWGQIQDKFKVEISDGVEFYYNERLRIEKSKRQSFVESRTNNRSGVNQHTKNKSKLSKKIKGHMTEHMEDEDKNENKDIIEVKIPFTSEKFNEVWATWKKYKWDEHKFKYKSPISEQAALNKIDRISGHNENISIAIIRQSIENGWEGLFELSTRKDTKISKDYKQSIIDDITETK